MRSFWVFCASNSDTFKVEHYTRITTKQKFIHSDNKVTGCTYKFYLPVGTKLSELGDEPKKSVTLDEPMPFKPRDSTRFRIVAGEQIYILLKKEYFRQNACEDYSTSKANHLASFLSGDKTYLVLKSENYVLITPGCSNILDVDFSPGQYFLVKDGKEEPELSFYLSFILGEKKI